MPILRTDFLTGNMVVISQIRRERPFSYREARGAPPPRGLCPFCPENARLTPKRLNASADGRVRAVMNKYPAFTGAGARARGFCEVVIDTDRHGERFMDFRVSDIKKTLSVLRERLLYYYGRKKTAYVQIFKNDGVNAGASVFHSHWQLFALDFLPEKIQRTLRGQRAFYRKHGVNYADAAIRVRAAEYAFYENAAFAATVPKSAFFAHMVRIFPKTPLNGLGDFTDKGLFYFADALKKTAYAINAVLPDASYNICFYGAPNGAAARRETRFYAEVIPRLGKLGGFELSTGVYINDTPPEKSCEALRRAVSKAPAR